MACSKASQSEADFIRHLEIKRFECKWCNKRFVDYDKLKVHGRTHTGEKPWSVHNLCSRVFVT